MKVRMQRKYDILSEHIIKNMFLNRQNEVSKLKQTYAKGNKQLVIVYGPHGSGKTELLKQILPQTRYIYLVPSGYNQKDLINNLWKQIKRYDREINRPAPETPKDLFQVFQDMAVLDRVLIVIDEFDFVQRFEPSFIHDFRMWWLGLNVSVNLMVVLISPVSSVFDSISRRDKPDSVLPELVINLDYIDYKDSLPLMAGFLPKDAVSTYAVFGKYPFTLSRIVGEGSLLDRIKSEILHTGGSLFDLPLRRISDLGKYMNKSIAVMEMISRGIYTAEEIAKYTHSEREEVSNIISKILYPYGLVEKKRPVLDSVHSRNFKYSIADNFNRFWFNFVSMNRNELLLGNFEASVSDIMSGLNDFVSPVFAEIALQHLSMLSGVNYNHKSIIGQWWNRDIEIDGVAVSNEDSRVYFMSTVWSDKPVERDVLNALIRKASDFPWKKNDRKDLLVIYSKSGFRFETDEATLVNINRMQHDLDSRVTSG